MDFLDSTWIAVRSLLLLPRMLLTLTHMVCRPGDGLSFKINPEKAQLLEKLSTQLREGVVIEEGRRSESTFSVGDEEEDSDAG